MRWDGLFADLEAQFDAVAAAERATEIEDRARVETGRLRLADRLRPAIGGSLRVRYPGDLVVIGVLSRVGPGWMLLDEGAGRDAFAMIAPLLSVAGLSRLAASPDTESIVESRLGVGYALRGIARDRSSVRISMVDGSVLDGTIDRVGQDFIEIATHNAGELRRRHDVREVLAVAFSALAVIRRDA